MSQKLLIYSFEWDKLSRKNSKETYGDDSDIGYFPHNCHLIFYIIGIGT